ncbi:hypothetical protein LDX78_16855, partial [Acinetobacter baumannii]
EWVHVQLHQQKGMISLSPPTICNSAYNFELEKITLIFKQGLFKQDKPLLFWGLQTICLQNKPIMPYAYF